MDDNEETKVESSERGNFFFAAGVGQMIETQYPLLVSAINPLSSMANDDENFFDAIIVGTGLTESILAAYVRA